MLLLFRLPFRGAALSARELRDKCSGPKPKVQFCPHFIWYVPYRTCSGTPYGEGGERIDFSHQISFAHWCLFLAGGACHCPLPTLSRPLHHLHQPQGRHQSCVADNVRRIWVENNISHGQVLRTMKTSASTLKRGEEGRGHHMLNLGSPLPANLGSQLDTYQALIQANAQQPDVLNT